MRSYQLTAEGHPIWYCGKGSRMFVASFDKSNNILTLGHDKIAHLTIRLHNTEGWLLSWYIRHSIETEVRGCTWMSDDELKAAFGITDETSLSDDRLKIRFGADSVVHGRYIRWQKYLNIPGPGTGHAGDPNISIEIDESIKSAVRQLL